MLGVAGYVVAAVHGSRRRGYTDEFVLTPEDLNMPYEEVQFFTEDGISLTGWFIPQSSGGRPSRRVVVCCHPYNNSKSNLLGVARGLWDRRYSVFMFDFRSFADTKTQQSVGFLEQRDCRSAILAAKGRAPEDAKVALVGASMGGAVALMVGHEEGAATGVVGVATDCAFGQLTAVLEGRVMATVRFPRPLAAAAVQLADWLNPWCYGYALSEVSPVTAVAREGADVPLLLIHADHDEVVPVSQAHAIYSAASCAQKDLVVMQHCHHVGCFFQDRARYVKLLADFFDSAFAAAEGSVGTG
ncbi:unnamed protein product [Effrenium voratum]|nr:unnamed protein product [Effrenium voratum]